MWAQVFNILFGLSLMILPGLLGFGAIASDNNYIVGPLVVTFAVIARTEIGRSARWLNVVAGLWLVLSPFILDFGGVPRFADIGLGGIITILSFFKGKIEKKMGGGWISLFQENPPHIVVAREIRNDGDE